MSVPSIHHIIGKNIRHRRHVLKLSQQALGDYLGVTFQQVQKYERGSNGLSIDKLVGLTHLFRCNLYDLLEDPLMAQMQPMDKSYVDQTMAAFTRINNPKLRRNLWRLIETIADE